MSKKWYVIANSSEAKVYLSDNESKELNLHDTLVHPESRMKGSNIVSDRPGHYESHGDGHGSFVEKTNPKDYEADRFANEIGHYLKDAYNKNQYKELIIAASPHFHGLINKHLEKHVEEAVVKHIEKDLTGIAANQITKTITNYMNA
ncbi:MAG: host attachment protein [Gammaproteobacteria bacterium]|nr:host attachment protein [Gammaproteobacteria bacterium]